MIRVNERAMDMNQNKVKNSLVLVMLLLMVYGMNAFLNGVEMCVRSYYLWDHGGIRGLSSVYSHIINKKY